MATTYKVSVHQLRMRNRADRKNPSYELTWVVEGALKPFRQTFKVKKQGESAWSKLNAAAKDGVAFDTMTGRPVSEGAGVTPTALDMARTIYRKEWSNAGGKTRKSTAENLAHAVALLVDPRHEIDDTRRTLLYQALYQGGLSPEGLRKPDPESSLRRDGRLRDGRVRITRAHHEALKWLERNSIRVGDIDMDICETVLDRLSTNVDGSLAGPNTRTRRRNGLSKLLERSVVDRHISSSPLRSIKTKAAQTETETISETSVASVALVPAALRAIAAKGARGFVFAAALAVVFYAGARPAEAVALRLEHCDLPETGWGALRLRKSAPSAGGAWTDSGDTRDDRGLKRRQSGTVRRVPIPPVLVAILRALVTRQELTSGLLFTTTTGAMLSESELGEFWRYGRSVSMPGAAVEDLARVYDLRHACASLWLLSVPVVKVAAWLGHSAAVCSSTYFHVIPSDEDRWYPAMEASLPV